MSTKKIRDPIYGYIEIGDDLVSDIIDTAAFQRLRQIRQTSYEPLYPSALHNRFVHSLGVYHLGKRAVEAFYESLCRHEKDGTKRLDELKKIFDKNFGEKYGRLFILACLLHDVGHSPFSHTGEDFYRSSISTVPVIDEESFLKEIHELTSKEEQEKAKKELDEAKKYTYHKHLAYLTKDEVFTSVAGEAPVAHEIMSCIVALETFGQDEKYFQNNEQRAFFARCITGLKYTDRKKLTRQEYMEMTPEEHEKIKCFMLLDCLIQLLHSSVIDVDRLDYIIRDASTMGYQSVSVDYERLLSGVEVVCEKECEFNFTIGFHRSAVSIIENAVYAHDIEKKWVQAHPAILYDSFLLQQTIIDIENRLREEHKENDVPLVSTLFSYDSLTDKGSMFRDIKIRYLSDPDLVYLMKNKYRSTYSDEYFKRNTRRVPVWKSEADFKNLFSKDERDTIRKAMEIILTDKKPGQTSAEVNKSTLRTIEQDIREAKEKNLVNMVESHEKKRSYFEALLSVCQEYGICENVLLLSTSFFRSNFSKKEMEELLIFFPAGRRTQKLGEVSSTLHSHVPPDDRFTYLFYYAKKGRDKIDALGFAAALVSAFKSCE